jgi:hypothetical protein
MNLVASTLDLLDQAKVLNFQHQQQYLLNVFKFFKYFLLGKLVSGSTLWWTWMVVVTLMGLGTVLERIYM